RTGLDGGHGERLAGGIGDLQRRASALQVEAYPQARGPGRQQLRVRPREGQRHLVCLLVGGQRQRVEGRVEQRRLDGEAVDLGRLFERDFGEQLLVLAPDLAQGLKDRAVGQAAREQALVQTVEVERLGGRRRPSSELKGGQLGGRTQQARSMTNPVPVGARVNAQRSPTGLVGRVEG